MQKLKIKLVYSRTITSLIFTVIIAFILIGIFYYQMVSVSVIRNYTEQMSVVSAEISNTLSDYETAFQNSVEQKYLKSYLLSLSKSTSSYIWVIDLNQEIIFNTGIPDAVKPKLIIKDNEHYALPATYIYGKNETSLVTQKKGLFSDSPSKWIITSTPILDQNSRLIGEIHLYHEITGEFIKEWYMLNAFLIASIATFTVSLVFIWIVSKNITEPIRQLAKVAGRVSIGDFSVRVNVKEKRFFGLGNEIMDHSTENELSVLSKIFNEMIERLEKQEQYRRDFISSVSHDLRTPLTSIKGFVEGMLDGTIPPESSPEYLHIVRNEARRMQILVDTMSEISVFNTGKIKLYRTKFDINELIRLAVISLENQLNKKAIDVRAEFYDEVNSKLFVNADHDAIERVVDNLLTNAIKYVPQHGVISITTTKNRRSNCVEVIIEDDGSGVTTGDELKIFEKFFRSEKSRTGEGHGLGLFICKELLAAHNQRIWVEKSSLGGAKFTFTLPIE